MNTPWEMMPLGKVANITSGGTPNRKISSYWGGTIPWVTTSLINFGDIHETDESITEEGLKKSSAKLFPVGTILLALYGQGITRGKVARLAVSAATNQACAAIIPKKCLRNGYLFQLLAHSYSKLRNLSNSGSQENLSAELLKQLVIPVPPLLIQERIELTASLWDKDISLTERLIAAKLTLRKGLMQQLLTGKRRFPEFGAPRTFHERVPVDWDFPRTEDVFESYSIKNRPEEPVLSVTQDQGVVRRDSLDRRIQADDANFSSYKFIEPGSFVISLRSFQGGLEYCGIRGLVSPAYHVIRPRLKVCDDYYRYYFKSPDFIQRLAVAVIGIRDGKQISYEDFSFMRIPVPPIQEQIRIANALTQQDRELSLLRAQLTALKTQKRGLMQQLLTGKVRVHAPASNPVASASSLHSKPSHPTIEGPCA